LQISLIRTAQPTAISSKRKAVDEPHNIPEIDSDDERLQQIDLNCDQVRRRIRSFLESGEMKKGEFQNAIGCSTASLNNFLGQNGPMKGSGSSTYENAFVFFKRRELQGIKQPKKKVKKADEQQNVDLSGIHLDGEDAGEVKVYETCDEVRKKVNAYLREPNVTRAGFCREISKTFQDGKKVSPKNLSDFLSNKGPSAGNTSAAFYAAYVYFEKLRIKEGKPKSKFREEMEAIWRREGFDIKTPSNRGFWCRPGERAYEDKYGHVTFR
jgi:hypothetical protein